MINVLDIQKHINSSVPWPLLVKVGKLSSTLSAIKAIKNRNTDKKICVALSSGVVDTVSLASDNVCFVNTSTLFESTNKLIDELDFDILILESKDACAQQLSSLSKLVGISVIVLER